MYRRGCWPTQPFSALARMGQASSRPFAQDLPFELGEDRQQAGHGATGGCGQIQRLGQGNEADAEVLQFLECRQQVRNGPAPAVQTPHQHDIDFPPASGLQQFLAGFSPHCPRVHLTHLQGDRPSAASRVLAHGPVLHHESLLVAGRDPGVQAGPKHLRSPACLAKNVGGFCLPGSPFCSHSRILPDPGHRGSFLASGSLPESPGLEIMLAPSDAEATRRAG